MKKLRSLSAVYAALIEMSNMRDAIGRLAGTVAATETARLLSQIEAAEAVAHRLLDQADRRTGRPAH